MLRAGVGMSCVIAVVFGSKSELKFRQGSARNLFMSANLLQVPPTRTNVYLWVEYLGRGSNLETEFCNFRLPQLLRLVSRESDCNKLDIYVEIIVFGSNIDTGELKIWLESGFQCETVDSYGVYNHYQKG